MPPITINLIIGIIFCLNVTPLLLTQAQVQSEQATSQQPVGRKKEEPREVKGPVQIIESKQSRFRNSIFGRSEKIIDWSRTTYDRQGRSTEGITFRSSGKPDDKHLMTYDDTGNLKERVVYDSKNIVTVRVNNKYDAHGRLIEELWYYPGYAHIANGENYKTIYKYDERKREKEQLDYDGQGRLVRRFLTTYNIDGKEIEQTCENPVRGYLICAAGKRVFNYDSRGNKTEQATDYSFGNRISGKFSKYNDQGKEIEWEIPGKIRVVNSYDSNDIKVESETYGQNRQLSTRTKYDSRGNVLIHARINPDGSLEKDYYVREFDIYGNLVKEIWWKKVAKASVKSAPLSEWLKDEVDKGKMIQVIDRKISYYK